MAIEFPANPSDQDSFVANNVTYIYDGTLGVWNIYSGTTYNGGFGGSGGANVTVSDSAPSSPSAGDLWWESDVGRLKIYYDDGDTQQWVDASPSSNTVGGSNSVIAPAAIGLINSTSGTGTGLSWGNWDAGNGTLDITFDNAQPDANYAVVTDGEANDDGRLVSVQNKTTTGFEISLYDSVGVQTPSAINIFTVIVYASTPTQLVQTNPYSDNAVDSHLNVSGATTGEVLSWTGTDYNWVTAASGGASVTTSDTAPSNPSDGDLWFDSTTLKTFVYYNDGSSSQWVTLVPTTGGTGAGVTTYADTATMVQETPDAGSLGFVTANNNLYLYNGSGWGKVNVTNIAPVINSVEDASANTTPFSLATDGTPTVITVDATDPEGFPLTYTYSVSSGTLGTTATVTQGTAPNTNEFTITPGTNDPADAGTFDLTFTVDDGYASVDSTATFSLAFIQPITWGGDRGVVAGGDNEVSTVYSDMDYFDITTPGNASDFGNLTGITRNLAAFSDSTYGVWAGGVTTYGSAGTYLTRIDYATIATINSATSFGNLTLGRVFTNGCSNGTRGLIVAGSNQNNQSVIDYVTIATPSNATTFGNVTTAQNRMAACADSTYGVFAPGSVNQTDMEYVTIATPSNASFFGNLGGVSTRGSGGCSNSIHGFWCGGSGSASSSTDILTFTIATTGNASSFGTLTTGSLEPHVTSNSTRAVVGIGVSGGAWATNPMEYFEMSTGGNTTNFGNMFLAREQGESTSGNAA